MMFNWQDFIKLGELFVSARKEGLQEAHYRTAISRLYYGTFGLIRETLESKGLRVPRDKNVHLCTIEMLRRSESEKEREIGLHLDRLRRERNIADYDNEFSINESRAQNSLKYAKLILKRL